ncbi:MAG: phage terminase large subunit family protein [Planctomycetota bacterium]|jgi:phage terminase large subunit-like protein
MTVACDPALMERALDLLKQIKESSKHQQLKAHYQKTHAQGGYLGPYDWQVKFHNASIDHNERAIIAANRTGKTRSGAADVAIHATGQYPPWWEGRRFQQPIIAVVAGCTNEDVRNVQQKALLGEMVEGERRPDGSGWVPSDCLGLCTFRQCGVPNVCDTIRVKHTSGDYSYIMFKSYEQGAVKFQGFEAHLAWLDEEPPPHLDDIFSEVRTRIMTTDGILIFTRTPLMGMSRIVRHFLDGGPGIWHIGATWEDAPHLARAVQDRYRLTYLDHEVDARTKGVPMLGTGGVYPVPDEQIRCKPFEIPDHYRRICGVDFGIDHPFAAVWLAYDADEDVIYVYDCYKEAGQTTSYHASAIKSRGKWIPVSWPHDGMIRDKGGGVALKDQYLMDDVAMLPVSARYDDAKGSGQAREPATLDILDRMRTGRFKVFEHLSEWFSEKRLLHRQDGKIVARDDDLESATRYACMMIRYATSPIESDARMTAQRENVSLDYNPLEAFSRSPY